MNLQPGDLFEEVYQIERELGRGGMATVFLAEHVFLKRKVALKIPLGDTISTVDTRDRFEREATLLARLNHENVVGVYDMRWNGRASYIAMEYIDGHPLMDYVRALPTTVTLGDVMGILQGGARALDYAHRQGVVHRDLKPTNMLVTREGARLKILDLGLARGIAGGAPGAAGAEFRTGMGIVFGTPGYTAPEQFRGKEAVPSSDIFSFGVVLYRLLTNLLPWDGKGDQLIMAQNIQPPIPPSTRNAALPKELDALFAKCLAKVPEERPRSAGEFFIAVLRGLGRDLVTAPYANIVRLRPSEAAMPGLEPKEVTKPHFGDITVQAALDVLFN